MREKGTNRICVVTDSLPFAGLAEEEMGNAAVDKIPIHVEGGVARYDDGTICGSLLTMDMAMRNFREMTGVSIEDAIRCCSSIPAKSAGVFDRKGDIAPDKDGDLVVLDSELRVKMTIKGGKIVFGE